MSAVVPLRKRGPGRPRTGRKATLTIRVDPDVMAQLLKAAKRHKQSISDEVRVRLAASLEAIVEPTLQRRYDAMFRENLELLDKVRRLELGDGIGTVLSALGEHIRKLEDENRELKQAHEYLLERLRDQDGAHRATPGGDPATGLLDARTGGGDTRDDGT
jgi:plasmid stability protein